MLKTIAQKTADYIKQAEALEKNRQSLMESLEEVMRNEIIPQLEPLLPPHYTISKNNSRVLFSEEKPNSVPTKISLDIALLYDKKPIVIGSPGERELGSIYQKIRPKLEQIASKYNVHSVGVGGEPARIA